MECENKEIEISRESERASNLAKIGKICHANRSVELAVA